MLKDVYVNGTDPYYRAAARAGMQALIRQAAANGAPPDILQRLNQFAAQASDDAGCACGDGGTGMFPNLRLTGLGSSLTWTTSNLALSVDTTITFQDTAFSHALGELNLDMTEADALQCYVKSVVFNGTTLFKVSASGSTQGIGCAAFNPRNYGSRFRGPWPLGTVLPQNQTIELVIHNQGVTAASVNAYIAPPNNGRVTG